MTGSENGIDAGGNQNDSASNSYLEMRKAKIERNQKVLASLGLSGSSPKKPIKTQRPKIESEQTMGFQTRRSSRRLRNASSSPLEEELPSKALSDAIVEKVDAILPSLGDSKRQRAQKRPRSEELSASLQQSTKITRRPIVQSEAKPGTTRATTIDVKKTLCGHFDSPVFVGRRLANTGKVAVVEHAAFMCGIESGIGFNKYSGICEFRNEAIFLWVNIGVPNADVKNEFLNDGKQMTWFGGSKMREESAAIQKLISIGQKATQRKLDENCGIVLWCRMYNKSSKGTFEPYTCLGRLGYHSHEVDSSPLKFVWNLLDADVLMGNFENKEEEKSSSLFQQIIGLAQS